MFTDERTLELMSQYLTVRNDRESALLVNRYGSRISVRTVERVVHIAAINADIKKHVTPHTLRHSFATNLLVNDANLTYVAKLLGHSSLETTAHYTHLVDQDLQRQYEQCHTL